LQDPLLAVNVVDMNVNVSNQEVAEKLVELINQGDSAETALAKILGSRGGKAGGPLGGKNRWKGISAKQRTRVMRALARRRWGPPKKKTRSRL
jgi:hypothetical protein